MKISMVVVNYGELRSGPGFNNTRIEVALGAMLDSGDTAEGVKEHLFTLAKTAVKKKFGDLDANQTEMDIPF